VAAGTVALKSRLPSTWRAAPSTSVARRVSVTVLAPPSKSCRRRSSPVSSRSVLAAALGAETTAA